jgi:two-component system CheB/CheR fusion protein
MKVSRPPSAKAARSSSGQAARPIPSKPSEGGNRSTNKELTALNLQLHEALERQRATSHDLQNVLYSTDVATIFLDTDLNVRLFTPVTKLLFSIVPVDIGRPLADLSSLAADGALLSDARTVLENFVPVEREIEAKTGAWYIRRILPYRTADNGVEGVVITFVDVTERRRYAEALAATERKAQLANVAKSRFLAAASHDLRQPLQTLVLLQSLLARVVEGERAIKLLARLDDTLSAMTGMLNTLLDINQIEAGTVHPEMKDCSINVMLVRVGEEFAMLAQAKKLALRVVRCNVRVTTDPRLLEQMIRNLLSNALKYTKRGKILLGCRHRGGILIVQVLDTGNGIPDSELDAIFEEYHQLNNLARERSLGLGLGLAIVQRLGKLMGHKVHVASKPGKGSVFSIEVGLAASQPAPNAEQIPVQTATRAAAPVDNGITILVVDDDPDVRDLLALLLETEGYRVAAAGDGIAALELVNGGAVRPALILADYNLPHGMNGLQLKGKLRKALGHEVPVIILTGDISTETLRSIAERNCVQLNKPVKPQEIADTIRHLLAASQAAPAPKAAPTARGTPPPPADGAHPATIFVVDDDDNLRGTLREVLEEHGHAVEDFASSEAFLQAHPSQHDGCLLIDAYLPGMSGLDLLNNIRERGDRLPAIMITGDSDVAMAVTAMKAGAADFIEKPVGREELLAGVQRALERARDATKQVAWHQDAASHLAGLTQRQREIMNLVLAGHPSKNIAADLGISQRTVENHRASIMKRTGSKSLPALARLALVASGQDRGE